MWPKLSAAKDEAVNIDQVSLESLSDTFTRKKILEVAKDDFRARLESLIGDVQSPSIRSKLRENKSSFDSIMQISQLRWQVLAPVPGVALLGAFVYMAIYRSIRQAEQTQGRSQESLNVIIDKLRRCNDLGSKLYSRCSDPRIPQNHVRERLEQAYRLLLSFTGFIIETLDKSPLCKEIDNFSGCSGLT